MMYVQQFIISLACFLALLLTGCASQARQTGTVQRVTERVGVEAGQPVQITETTTERSTAEVQANAGPDVAKVVGAAMAGFKGDILGALQSLKPAEPAPSGGIDMGTGGAIGTAVTMGALALRELLARKQAQKDAEDEYKRANEAARRAEEYARHLPPPTTPTPNVPSTGA